MSWMRGISKLFAGIYERIIRHWHTLFPIAGLFLVALLLRIAYAKLTIDYLGLDGLTKFATDSRLYLLIGDHILSWHDLGGYGLFRVGPGYGLILAAIKLIFGSNLIWPITFNILMGSLAPVFVYLLAYNLFDSRPIAAIAGLISAVSLTSIALSCHILTDQPFFTLHAAALVSFVYGWRTGRRSWFVIAGLLAAFAAYVRPIGSIWPYIFLFLVLVIPLGNQFKSRWGLIKSAGLTGVVALIMILGWSARNYVIHDRFTYCTNGILTVRSCLVAQVAQNTWGEGRGIISYRDQWSIEDGDYSEDYAAAYDKANARISAEFERHPEEFFKCYRANLIENMTAPNYFVLRQLPILKPLIISLNTKMEEWLGRALIYLTLAGLALMLFDGRRTAFWILGLTYASFSVLLGASFWQGSRLHYPAEMAWAIVLAFVSTWVVNKLTLIIKLSIKKINPNKIWSGSLSAKSL